MIHPSFHCRASRIIYFHFYFHLVRYLGMFGGNGSGGRSGSGSGSENISNYISKNIGKSKSISTVNVCIPLPMREYREYSDSSDPFLKFFLTLMAQSAYMYSKSLRPHTALQHVRFRFRA